MVKNGLLLTIFLSIVGILGAFFIPYILYIYWSDNFYFNRCFNDLFV